MKLVQRANRRGASRRRNQRRSFKLPALPQRALLSVVMVGLLSTAAYGIWHIGDLLAAVPVARVVFSGELRHVEREQLVAKSQPVLAGAGFFSLDLARLQTALETLPWVDRVAVIRRWPNQLEVVVTEQQPVARWGQHALLNHRGEIFRPEHSVEIKALPQLVGPDAASSEVVERYGALATLLAEANLQLVALRVDERGSWNAELVNGVRLQLGSDALLERARRFMQVYRAELEARFEQVAYIDLRYGNGLAVGWKPTVQPG